MQRLVASLFSLLLSAALAAQLPDLIFERGNPAAFQTLQAALDAAQPGQRILMRSPSTEGTPHYDAEVRKSVTIEGQYAQEEFVLRAGGGLRIYSLTPDVPMVLRNVQFSTNFNGGYHPQAMSGGSGTDSSVVLEDVRLTPGPGAYWSGAMFSIGADRLTMRRCHIVAEDIVATTPCCSPERQADGMTALSFSGQWLYLEDCWIQGGNASRMTWTEPEHCWGTLCPEGGAGGTALHAQNAVTLAVRTFLSDGNGGEVLPGDWPRPPVQGRPSPSLFRQLFAYDTQHQHGLPATGGMGRARGPIVRIGYRDAPLSIGPARIGHPVNLDVMQPIEVEPIAIALSTSHHRWAYESVFGSVHVPLVPPPPVVQHGVGRLSLSIPPLPDLIGQPLFGQSITTYRGFPFLSNTSVSVIGR